MKRTKRCGKRLARKFGAKCFWCGRSFGEWVFKKSKLIYLIATVDHVLPFVYSEDDSKANLVPACQICNMIKHDLVFDSIEKTRAFILAEWTRRNYQVIT